MTGIIWCSHCGAPHKIGSTRCKRTGKPIEKRLHERGDGDGDGARHPLTGTIIDGKYLIRTRLGSGGMGEVFEADDIVRKQRVALKIAWAGDLEGSDSDAIARLHREAAVIASLKHPNICRLHEMGQLPDRSPYLVLERLYGQTLEAWIRRRPRMSFRGVVDIFTQILTAVDAAHAAGIVHRDLKPANVFLVDQGGQAPLVKLLDFGFAKDISGRFERMTSPGRTCGTPTYMSPEQLLGRHVDTISDLFAVGVMLFEAITGKHPFSARTVAQVSINIVRAATPSVRVLRPNVSEELDRVVVMALQKEPSRRYQSALAMRAELAQLLNHNLDDFPSSSDVLPVPLREAAPSSSDAADAISSGA